MTPSPLVTVSSSPTSSLTASRWWWATRSSTTPAPIQPGGIAAGGSAVAVVGVRACQTKVFDEASLEALATVVSGAGPTHVVADEDRAFVTDTLGGAVLVLSLRPDVDETARRHRLCRLVEALVGEVHALGGHRLAALVTEVETALKRQLSTTIKRGGRSPRIRSLKTGQTLVEQGRAATELYLLLDGVLAVDVDGQVLAEVGPVHPVPRAIHPGDHLYPAEPSTMTIPAATACSESSSLACGHRTSPSRRHR